MKSKRFLCTVLACVVMISCITNAAAIQEEVADDFVEYNTESIDYKSYR
jgi:outer membrane lipoprotein-sorting protein